MSLLQAARAHVLGLSLESAYSWGLTKAIFYAAAKRGFKSGGGTGGGKGTQPSKSKNVYFLGDDMAFKQEKGGVLLFTFGGKVQTKEEFDKRVRERFGEAFREAWKEAVAYVKEFDKETLLSAEGFYHEVYKPRRDGFAEAWTAASEKQSPSKRG